MTDMRLIEMANNYGLYDRSSDYEHGSLSERKFLQVIEKRLVAQAPKDNRESIFVDSSLKYIADKIAQEIDFKLIEKLILYALGLPTVAESFRRGYFAFFQARDLLIKTINDDQFYCENTSLTRGAAAQQILEYLNYE